MPPTRATELLSRLLSTVTPEVNLRVLDAGASKLPRGAALAHLEHVALHCWDTEAATEPLGRDSLDLEQSSAPPSQQAAATPPSSGLDAPTEPPSAVLRAVLRATPKECRVEALLGEVLQEDGTLYAERQELLHVTVMGDSILRSLLTIP